MSILENLKPIVSLCKRRGFIYPGSDIYGGFANTYSFGPYGAQLKKNIKDLWWKIFVTECEDIVGLDGPILLHPTAWKASGHAEGFNDSLVDCRQCKGRFRVDHLIEKALNIEVEGLNLSQLDRMISDHKLTCPKCGKSDFTHARHFNLMFQTHMGKTSEGSEESDFTYLRPETAQAIFLDFKNIVDSTRMKVPFGVAQIGKAFRNEITPGNFIFRVVEFEQMEIEYFLKEENWKESFEEWLKKMQLWCEAIGLSQKRFHLYEHPQEKLSHYSKRTVDIVYDFPFGRSELYGLAYRTDFDLKQHQKFCGKSQEYVDPVTKEKYIPHVIEPTFGVERTLLAILCDAYEEQTLPNSELRTVLHLSPNIAPVKAAVFPLMNKDPLSAKARSLFKKLKTRWDVEYDDSGAIGKRYRRQDELGTPFCITIDFQTLEDNTVTLRNRDSMEQIRLGEEALLTMLSHHLTKSLVS